ncbi:MAG: enoyl-CoA hydratase/isomerase family protein [Proteobacteria bacterium]|nr:enoyl-CoA hydratase/isomerase family protein [Pseudomonadota bacterium]MBU4383917.1 enoyl-CoA hydratase/isomerase family protein [Pseudomonadota bacterium]MCG2763560.1 enoyl-CoA hydratase-related protein [Desulfarculaceae bacterium]
MTPKYLKLKIVGGVGWIYFNRPEKLNALSAEVNLEFEAVLAEWQSEDAVKVIVLAGSEKAFIAGADIAPMSQVAPNKAYDLADVARRVQERLCDLPKPTIAAISGYALGGGCEVALCCDFRIAADNAVFGLPEITLGIIPGGGGTQRLPRLVGLGPATEMIFLGKSIEAFKALDLGLAHQVVPLGQLEAQAQKLAEELMSRPAIALRAAKAALRSAMSTSLKEGLQIEQQLFCQLFATCDQKEGMAAFLEKRKPQFSGQWD